MMITPNLKTHFFIPRGMPYYYFHLSFDFQDTEIGMTLDYTNRHQAIPFIPKPLSFIPSLLVMVFLLKR